MSEIKKTIRSLLNRWDLDVFQVSALDFTQSILRKRKLFDALIVDLVLDVGANEGQYGSFLRDQVGYSGNIVSFEPVRAAFTVLERKAFADGAWVPINIALGAIAGTETINISSNTQSSSILGILERCRESAPDSSYVGSEQIKVSTLDSIASDFDLVNRSVYLKIDTQGFEKNVLDGAIQSLGMIEAIEIEMSFVLLYENQILFKEMHAHMRQLGYLMTSIEPIFCDPATGEILQADVVFRRAPRNRISDPAWLR